jgi:hypothetical protein
MFQVPHDIRSFLNYSTFASKVVLLESTLSRTLSGTSAWVSRTPPYSTYFMRALKWGFRILRALFPDLASNIVCQGDMGARDIT